ncbi:MAG: hypothetical protein CVT60_03550 [Actinobacteria bacterium HGW-Actinobacteria-10]|nr:MAG: hypothetical protein CVT60_03550 [Actinobacteria bacterium HGW-Actinobacteria-10]
MALIIVAMLCVLVSAAMSYVVGYAVIAPRDSGIRSKRNMLMLIMGALSLIPLPPQLLALGAASGAAGGMMPGLSLSWPAGISASAYIALWVATSIVALLAGMRIWNAGQPGWLPGTQGAAYDSSASGRAAALIAMANSLDDVLDALRRTDVDAKSVERIAEEIRHAGRRFGSQLPEESGAAYRLVMGRVGPAIASDITRYLLEGAGRAGQIAHVRRA